MTDKNTENSEQHPQVRVDCGVRHEALKVAMGIATANCQTCACLGTECDGNFAEFAVSWPVCSKFDRYQYLKPFPFKTEQKCWEPEFWHSKFANMIDGSDESMQIATKAFMAAKSA